MVLIYADRISNRLEYTAKLIFNDILNTGVRFTDNVIVFRQSDAPGINYSATRFGNELFIRAGDFLFGESVEMPEISPVDYDGITGFFPASDDSVLPFDPFASAFLAVSRMEEYSEGPVDSHGRFLPENSFLVRHGLLEKAIVNRWADCLAIKIRERYRHFTYSHSPFRFLTTIDVDNTFAYLGKGIVRSTGALLKCMAGRDWENFGKRLKVLWGRENDPYDTFGYLTQYFRGNEKQVKFFFHVGDIGKYDRQVSWKNRRFQDIIRNISGRFTTGIHPSYRSSKHHSPKIMMKEKKRLSEIIREEVTISRQHFLLLSFPQTYRNLISSGISEDYSMGYPGIAGFRAGTCTPFYFYDLIKEEATSLKIIPFMAMDVTLRQYLGLSPEDASEKIEMLMNEVKSAGGLFCSIWHNESLHDSGNWKGYREVFENMNQLGFDYAGTND
jgi:hypothetical protein